MSEDLELLAKLLEVYDQKCIAEVLTGLGEDTWNREKINRWLKGKVQVKFSRREFEELQSLLPSGSVAKDYAFKFIDLFAGIGGIRKGFEGIGGKCVFTSEWNKYAVKTYKANFYNCPEEHFFNNDIRDITLSEKDEVSEFDAYRHIDQKIPHHDVLLAGFPVSLFLLREFQRKMPWAGHMGSNVKLRGPCFLM